ncbi:uncharacterized protein [Argopecten irradians]|uniref:uncharacterized protein n=1 Tax=Argopecten irradians TaxID=31199 RepID=UPI00371FCB94
MVNIIMKDSCIACKIILILYFRRDQFEGWDLTSEEFENVDEEVRKALFKELMEDRETPTQLRDQIKAWESSFEKFENIDKREREALLQELEEHLPERLSDLEVWLLK